MSERSPDEPERAVLAEPDAKRVLSRAIELEHVRAAGSTVADLRAVASEVGVSAGSFDAALAELDASKTTPVPAKQKGAPRRVRLSVIAGAAIALFAFYVFMRIPAEQAARSSVPMIEEAVLLRCLSAEDAAALIRPLLRNHENTMLFNMSQTSRVLTIRATAEQWPKIRALLDQYEGAGSAACPVRPATSVKP